MLFGRGVHALEWTELPVSLHKEIEAHHNLRNTLPFLYSVSKRLLIVYQVLKTFWTLKTSCCDLCKQYVCAHNKLQRFAELREPGHGWNAV